MEPLYKHIAMEVQAYRNCMDAGNTAMADRHVDGVYELIKRYMPSGSGINAGTEFDWRSTGSKLIFFFEYHHIKSERYTSVDIYHLFVTPSLINGIDLRLTGCKDSDLADYLYQTFRTALLTNIETL